MLLPLRGRTCAKGEVWIPLRDSGNARIKAVGAASLRFLDFPGCLHFPGFHIAVSEIRVLESSGTG